MAPLPLAGLRVLDISQVMAGPFCCMLLGDMGADVIKIEPPTVGDSTRHSMGFRLKGEDSPGFLALNRNKRSITLNLKDDADREVLYALVKTADILIENARPGVAARLGIDYDTLSKINPRLVYASISGFGQTGPWAQRPGFDLIAQAMSGVLSSNGFPGMEPAKNSIAVADLGAGLFTAYGVLSAIIGREKSGEGQYVDASLLEAALGLSVWETTELWGTGKSPTPIGSANRMSAPYQAVLASDGWFVIGAANQGLWLTFLTVIGRPELQEDPLYSKNAARVSNRVALIKELAPTFLTRTKQEWIDAMLAAGVPAAPILDYGEAVTSEQAVARDMVMQVPHPIEGEFKSLGFPVKMRGTPQQVRMPPPLLDEHGDEIRRELIEKGLLPGCCGGRGMTEARLVYDKKGDEAHIRFDNPRAHNALTGQMWHDLRDAARDIANDPTIRVATFRGVGGKAFISGTDISKFADYTTGEQGVAYERDIDECMAAVDAIPCTTIAIVEGWAVGGGLNISSACDFRIATPTARFGSPIGRTLGNCLSAHSVARIGSAIGAQYAKRMVLLGEIVAAPALLASGFLHQLVESEELDAAAEMLCRRARENAPLTTRATKEMLLRMRYAGLPNVEDLIGQVYGSADFQRGVANFLSGNKALPDWTGK